MSKEKFASVNWDEVGYYPNGVVDNDTNKVFVQFRPMNHGHEFQGAITQRLHEIICDYSDLTMAEMGFMHQVYVAYENGRVRIRLYFHPELATTVVKLPNGQPALSPIPELSIMNGFFFIARTPEEMKNVLSIEKVLMPKTKIELNERGRKVVKFKKDGTDLKLQEMVCVECNFLLTVACVLNVRLDDPNYGVSIETLGQADKKKKSIMIDGKENTHPIWVRATYTNPAVDDTFQGYDVTKAIPYLSSLIEAGRKAKAMDKELGQKVADKAEKAEKKTSKKRQSFKYM